MAKLYRRVPRFPRPHLGVAGGWCLLVASLALAPRVQAQRSAQEAVETAAPGDPRLVRLEGWLADLRSEDEGRRQGAYDALTTLDETMLPAIRARIARVRRERPAPHRAYDTFSRIRRAAGSTRADDDVDLAPGVLVVLREDRSDRVLRMAEPLLLWRSLERMGTLEAGQAMYPLIGLDGDLWRWEERRVVARMGRGIIAAAILGRADADPRVREWSSAALRRLRAEVPGLAVQQLEPAQLVDVLRAFAMTRVQSAMRVIASFVTSDHRSVRRAARWALAQYGGNAVWALRAEYHTRTGERAPEQWGWRRLTDALYARLDAQRTEPVRRAREAGLAALERGELEEARRQLADVLARSPDVEEPRPIAEAYAALGAAALREGALDRAEDYRRALRLDPEHPEAPRWRGALAFAEAERSRARGVLDPSAYEDVLAVDPAHEGALRALALAERHAAVREPPHRAPWRWALWAALGLAMLGGILALGGRPRRREEAFLGDPEDTPTSPGFEEADPTLADSTLPG